MTDADARIDRIAPTRRPSGPAAGSQRWRDLLFLHWPIAVAEARRLVPASLELDLFEGQAHVGLVLFRMEGVRPFPWWPESLGFAFPETNVRLYVHHQGRPGVFFLSLDAHSHLAVAAARALWGLPYYYASMTCARDGERVAYRSRRPSGASAEARCRPGAPLPVADPEGLRFFLMERYLLFVERRGRLRVGQVHHAPYPAREVEVEVESVEESLLAAAGIERMDAPPMTAHFSDGVDVDVFALRDA